MFNNKIEWNKKHKTIIAMSFIIITFAILFYKFVGNWDNTKNFFNSFFQLLAPFLYGFLFAFLLNPGVMWFERFYKKRLFKKAKKTSKKARYLATVTMYVIVFGFIIILLVYVIPQLFQSASSLFTIDTTNALIEKINELSDTINKNFNVNFDIEKYLISLENFIPNVLQTISDSLPQIIEASKSFTGGLFNIILGILISIYMINDKQRFVTQGKKFIYAIFKKPNADKILTISRETNTTFKNFFVGKALDSLIIGVLCYFLMKLLNFPFALLISVIVCITNMIPYFGPFIGAIPGFLIILIINPIKALWFILFILGLQQFDGIILGPKILGDSVGLRPFWIIFSITIGGGLFGFIGMLLGVPVFTVIYNVSKRYINRKLKEKNITKETD